MASSKFFLWISSLESDLASSPTISGGTAAPTASEPNGSTYHRTNGQVYTRIGGVWVANAINRARVAITAAELKALRATPKTLVAAPGAGFFLEFVSAHMSLVFVVVHSAPTNAGDDLGIRYTDGSGALLATQEATGFVNAAANAQRIVKAGAAPVATPTDVIPVDNAAIVLHNVGAAEFPGVGTSTMIVDVYYRVRPTAPAT